MMESIVPPLYDTYVPSCRLQHDNGVQARKFQMKIAENEKKSVGKNYLEIFITIKTGQKNPMTLK